MEPDDVEVPSCTHSPTKSEEANQIGASGDGEPSANQEPSPGNGISKTQSIYMQEVKDILDALNETREADRKMVSDFRTKMNEMVEEVCGQIEKKLIARYERTYAVVDAKLECLNEIMGRVGVLEQELNDFNGAVTLLFDSSGK